MYEKLRQIVHRFSQGFLFRAHAFEGVLRKDQDCSAVSHSVRVFYESDITNAVCRNFRENVSKFRRNVLQTCEKNQEKTLYGTL